MIKRLLPLLYVLSGAGLAAQAPIETNLSTPTIVVNARGVRTAAPREKLPRTATLAPTAKLAYASFCVTAAGLTTIHVSRTSDGGNSWSTTAIHTTVLNETITDLELVASGYAVFVAFLSNKKNPGVARNDVYVLGSSDEGATFSGPALVNTVTTLAPRGDAQILEVAAGLWQGNARCYLAYEHSPVTAKEDAYFTAVEMLGGVPVVVVTELLLNKATPAGTTDVDDVDVGADGGVVCVAWRDERGNVAGNNDMYAIVSLAGGSDFGSVTVNEKRISTNAGIGAIEPPKVVVGGPNCYVAWLDNRNDLVTVNDDAFLAYSNNFGATFTEVDLTLALARPYDIDSLDMAAESNTLVIAFEDDTRARQLGLTNPNVADATHVIVSKDGGVNRTSTLISTPPTAINYVRCEQPQVALAGDYVHVTWEESWYNKELPSQVLADEDVFMAKSFDGGLTFTTAIDVTRRGSATRGQALGGGDIDDPSIVVTGNGEAIVGFLDENPSTSSGLNFAHVAARSGLEVWSKFTGASGLEIRDAASSQAGALAIALLTMDPNPTPWFFPQVFGDLGFEPLLVVDNVTITGLNLIAAFSGFVPAGGGTIAMPIAPDLGGQLATVAVTFDPVLLQFRSFSARSRY